MSYIRISPNKPLHRFLGCTTEDKDRSVHWVLESAPEEQFAPICEFPGKAKMLCTELPTTSDVVWCHVIE